MNDHFIALLAYSALLGMIAPRAGFFCMTFCYAVYLVLHAL